MSNEEHSSSLLALSNHTYDKIRKYGMVGTCNTLQEVEVFVQKVNFLQMMFNEEHSSSLLAHSNHTYDKIRKYGMVGTCNTLQEVEVFVQKVNFLRVKRRTTRCPKKAEIVKEVREPRCNGVVMGTFENEVGIVSM